MRNNAYRYLKLSGCVAAETKAAPDKTDQRRVVVGVVSEADEVCD